MEKTLLSCRLQLLMKERDSKGFESIPRRLSIVESILFFPESVGKLLHPRVFSFFLWGNSPFFGNSESASVLWSEATSGAGFEEIRHEPLHHC